jgi:hypothetical protein
MENQERIAPLTELAVKAYPYLDQPRVVFEEEHDHTPTAMVVYLAERLDGDAIVLEVQHARALDALEAALCILSGQPLSVWLNAEIQLALNDRMARRAINAEAELAKITARVASAQTKMEKTEESIRFGRSHESDAEETMREEFLFQLRRALDALKEPANV